MPTCEILLFHSALGRRPAVLRFADRLREAGHVVHVPDLYDGPTFDDVASGEKHVESIGGIPELIRRTQAAVADLPTDVVYAGFSNGGVSAELLSATRPGARGALLMHAALPLEGFGAKEWPGTVPVQLHFGLRDPRRDQSHIDALAAAVDASGASFESFDYDVAGHLFADDDLPDYDTTAAELMLGRALAFLAHLGERR